MFLADRIINDARHPSSTLLTAGETPVGSAFSGVIGNQSLEENTALNIDASSNFSGSPTFALRVSPINPGIAIDQVTGIIAGNPAMPDTYHAVVVATLNGIESASNVFTLIVTEAPQSPFANEPIDFEVMIEPAGSDSLDNTIYKNNENAFIIPSVNGILTNTRIANPVITARLEEIDGTLIENITAISSDHLGRHAGVISENAAIDLADRLRLIINVSSPSTGDASMSLLLDVTDRIE